MSRESAIDDKPNRFYIISVTALTFVVPAIGFFAEHFARHTASSFDLFGTWFIFSAVALRLFLTGTKQVIHPEFTRKKFFTFTVPGVFQFFVG